MSSLQRDQKERGGFKFALFVVFVFLERLRSFLLRIRVSFFPRPENGRKQRKTARCDGGNKFNLHPQKTFHIIFYEGEPPLLPPSLTFHPPSISVSLPTRIDPTFFEEREMHWSLMKWVEKNSECRGIDINSDVWVVRFLEGGNEEEFLEKNRIRLTPTAMSGDPLP